MFSSNIDEQISPASITKVATALVLLDFFDIADSITISLPDNYQYIGKVAYLESGKNITIEDLLEFLLIYSANDAAYVAAMASTGSIESFIVEMNNKANSLGMKNTTFLNPDGLDQPGHSTTLRDLLAMSLKFIENNRLMSIASKKSFSSDITGIEKIYYSTNEIIDKGFIGIKTGWTSGAGLTFIGLNLDNGRQILTLVNKSIVDNKKITHFEDTQLLYQNSFKYFGNYESFQIDTEIYKVNNPSRTYGVYANETWKDFVDLRQFVNINFIDYVDGRLKFVNNISDREIKVSASDYKVLWEFNPLDIFSIFAN